MLKRILLFIGGFIALLLIIALFIDGKINYSKSILISAPISKVWSHTNTLTAMNQWSPWLDKDPQMKRSQEGQDGMPGASFCWQSEKKDVGSGCQTIKSVTPDSLFETDLLFKEPYESKAIAFVRLTPEGNNTKATWGFNSEVPYPFRITKIFMNMEKMIGPDYQLGLVKLKKICEE